MVTPVPAASPKGRRAAAAVAVFLVAAALIVSWCTSRLPALNHQPYEYDIVAWETRHFPNKWLYELGSLFHSEPEGAEADTLIARFLTLNREIEALEEAAPEGGAASQTVDLAAKRKERDRIENDVEAVIEQRLSTLLTEAGLDTDLLLAHAVWPPVDAEFTIAPRSLAVSPRDRIQLIDSDLLREDLSLEEVEAIEQAREQRDNVSALAFPTAGIGAYPTIIDYPTSYRGLAGVVAHEWMHNYLAFYPLGIRYYSSYDLRSMNETVAELVGVELGDALVERWPLPETAPPPATTPPAEAPQPRPRLDIGAELRRLRGEVDDLLAAGRIDAAEALMEQRRREFAAQGYYIRKINQAFFAFTNLYAGEAGTPGATNPIGPKIDELRSRSATLSDFVRTVREVTSVESLDRALEGAD